MPFYINKPFSYLRKKGWKWNYSDKYLHENKRTFMSPDHVLMLEKRESNFCCSFRDKKTKKNTKEAQYKILNPIAFLSLGIHVGINLHFDYSGGLSYVLKYICLGLHLIKNAEICLPTEEIFPLVIRNDKYDFYISPDFEGNIGDRQYIENFKPVDFIGGLKE